MKFRTSLLLAAAYLVFSPTTRAQHAHHCSSDLLITPALVAEAMAYDAERGGGGSVVLTVKLKVLIAALPDGVGGQTLALPQSKIQSHIDLANEIFDRCNTGIQFQLCGPMVVIEDAPFYFGNVSSPAVEAQKEAGYINVMYTGQLPGLSGGAFGTDALVAANATPNTLAHELGHVLGLLHTFETVFHGSELVDGSNCSTAGDLICDTPASPQLNLPGMVAPGCTYIGTVTDANGDVYNPQLNNLMGYGDLYCTADSLTPGQGALMRFVLENVLLQLRRTETPVVIEPFNVQQCEHAAPFTLSATPGPGVFSGPLVNGNTLTNSPAPPGEYAVQYVPDTPPESSSTLVDQWHGITTFPIPYAAYVTTSMWQSFRAQLTGEFQRFELFTFSAGAQPVRLRLYTGTGTQGTLLFDLTATMPSDTAWTTFLLPPGTASTDGTDYTALITTDIPFTVLVPSNNTYFDGESNLNGPDIEGPDVRFRHWVNALPDCQSTWRYYNIYQVPARPILNLPDAYCHSDTRTVQLVVEPFSLTSSTLLLDGAPLAPFTPASLGVGVHLAQHIYTLNGCTDTLDQAFVVEPPPDFQFPGLDQPICANSPPFVLEGEPGGGFFRINGVRDSLFVPSVLGVGAHTIDYLYTTELDVVSFTDQFCCNTNNFVYRPLGADTTVWQSFTAQQSGELTNIQVNAPWAGVTPRTFNASIYSGSGIGGPLLWSDSRTTNNASLDLFTDLGLQVEMGSTYTFGFNYVPDASTDPLPQVLYYTEDGYAAGQGSFPGVPSPVDLFFREAITQRFPCADSTSFTIQVEICGGIETVRPLGVSVGPNPFGQLLTITTANEPVRCEILSADGRIVHSHYAAAHAREVIGTERLSSGCYLLRLITIDGTRTEVVRVIRE